MPKVEKFEGAEYWKEHRESSIEARAAAMADYVRFSRWFVGDNADLQQNLASVTKRRRASPLSNLLSLAVTVSRAELFFRAPRFLVKPVQSMGPSIFTPQLANCETMLLNDLVDETGFFMEGRRAILDALLGPEMIFKVGYSSDTAVDHDRIQAERQYAQAEDRAILTGGRPKVKDKDYDKVHLEQHQTTLAAIERGDFPQATKGVVNYLKKHMKFHEDRLKEYGDRPLETIRYESVFVLRRSPARVWRDPMCGYPEKASWWQEVILRPVDDIRADPRYRKEAREKVEEDGLDDGLEHLEGEIYGDNIKCPDAYGVLYETIDLRRSKVITHAKGVEEPLSVQDYKGQRIAPSGPYITASLKEDPIQETGSPPPRAYEGHQYNLSVVDEVIAQAMRRSVPKTVVKKGAISAEEMRKIERGIPNALITLADMDPTVDINKVFQQIDMPTMSEFVFLARTIQERGIERQTGGSAKLGGGDNSKTATASAVVNESGSNVSEDIASVMDDCLSRVGRQAVREMRLNYTPTKVAEIVGEDALKVWPNSWSVRDIVRDRGVMVIPGSSRRKNIAVEQKMTLELYAILSKDPTVMQAPGLKLELLQRVLDAHGFYGVDLEEAKKQMEIQQVQALLAGAGGGESPEGAPGPTDTRTGPAGRTKRRASARGEGTRAAIGQGAANAGGGRIPTGASQGDQPRLMR